MIRAGADAVATGELPFVSNLQSRARGEIHPIAELPLTLLHHVFGDMGVAQYRFLHRQEGYGRAILESHPLDLDDTLILFSHSGINTVVLDMAHAGHEHGLSVIAVTSIPHSSSVA